MNNDYYKYGEAAIRSAEQFTSKVLAEINKGVSDTGLRLLRLIEIIPNWETYLTTKQLEAAEEYIKCLNACEVDYKLNLNIGTTQQRLFGNSTSKGALGRLEEIIQKLEKQGYFEKQKAAQAKQEEQENKKANLKPTISDKTKQEIRELLKLIIDMPDYEQYLTASQKERVFQFLRLKSIKQCAKYFNVTEMTFKQSLLGKGGQGGVLGRLKKITEEQTVDSWDNI
jgi:hypothetical protein